MLQDVSTIVTLVLSVLSATTVLIVVIVKIIRGQEVKIDLDKDGTPDIIIPGTKDEESNHS